MDIHDHQPLQDMQICISGTCGYLEIQRVHRWALRLMEHRRSELYHSLMDFDGRLCDLPLATGLSTCRNDKAHELWHWWKSELNEYAESLVLKNQAIRRRRRTPAMNMHPPTSVSGQRLPSQKTGHVIRNSRTRTPVL